MAKTVQILSTVWLGAAFLFFLVFVAGAMGILQTTERVPWALTPVPAVMFGAGRMLVWLSRRIGASDVEYISKAVRRILT